MTNNGMVAEKEPKYDSWLRNAPLEATHMLVLRDFSGIPFPWYVLEGQNVELEINHFGKRRIVVVFDVSSREINISWR